MNGDEESALVGNQTGTEAQRKRLARIDRELRHIIATNPGCLGVLRPFMFAFLVMGMITLPIAKLYNYHTPFSFLDPILFQTAVVVSIVYSYSIEKNRKQDRLKAISNATLVDLMIEGWENLPNINHYTPRALHFILGAQPKSDEAWTRLVAVNLSWFLKPPKPLSFSQLYQKSIITINLLLVLILLCITIFGSLYIPKFVIDQTYASILDSVFGFLLFTIGCLIILLLLAILYIPDVTINAEVIQARLQELQSEAGVIPPPASLTPPAAPPCPPG
jgi:hypothetical protein